MTPAAFRQALKTLSVELKHHTLVLPDTPASTVDQWLSGNVRIPSDVVDRLRYLITVQEELKLQALEETYASENGTSYWPWYFHDEDFKALDSQRYSTFLGCKRVYYMALHHAQTSFMRMEDAGSTLEHNIVTYTISRETFYPWLKKHGLYNSDVTRKRYVEEAHERHRPPTAEEYAQTLAKHIASPDTCPNMKRRYRSIQKFQKRSEQRRFEREECDRELFLPTVLPTPSEVVNDFFASPTET